MNAMSTRLRELMASGETVVAPGCFDAFTARVVQDAGFNAVYMSMWAMHTSQLGLPHVGVVSAAEFADHLRKITAAIDIPLIIDAEHGFGGAYDVQRAVRLFEQAGVAGLHIHDQTRGQGWLVRSDNVTAGLVTKDQMAAKIAAAKDAQFDPDFVVIGRTESTRNSSEEAVERCQAYVAAGADMVLPMASPWLSFHLGRDRPATRPELHELLRGWMRDIDAPLVVHSPFGLDFTIEEVNELGIGMWVIPQACLGFSAAATREAIRALKDGRLKEHAEDRPFMPIPDFAQIAGQAAYTDIAKKFDV